MDGGRKVKHPVKILAAVIRPVFPHALIRAIAHLLHVLENRFVLVERDAEFPLIAVADRAVLPAAALPCARPLHDEHGRAVFGCGARGSESREPRTDDHNVRGAFLRDPAVRDLRRSAEPCGRRRGLRRRRRRDQSIVRILPAPREQGGRGDEAAKGERASLEKIPAAERPVLFAVHRIRSFLFLLFSIIGAQMHKLNRIFPYFLFIDQFFFVVTCAKKSCNKRVKNTISLQPLQKSYT